MQKPTPGSWVSGEKPQDSPVTADEIETQLQKILQSSAFQNAPRHSRFLTFVVHTALSGQSREIKEYVLGVEVFDRPHNYDPGSDSIVRAEARRLRVRLADYYREAGSHDAIQIDLPKGGYVPIFSRRDAPSLSESAPQLPALDTGATPELARQLSTRRPMWKWGLVVMVLAATAGAAIYLQHRKSRAVSLTPTDTIVLADFSNSTGDNVFNGTLQQALTLQLAKSSFLNILSPAKVRGTLAQMGRSTTSPVTRETAREICQRTGSKLVLEGSVDRMGSEYVVGLRALNCFTGEQVAGDQERATRKEKVLDALASAAARTRTRLGESLASVQSTPIQEGTTTSLEALKFYNDGIDAQNAATDASSVPFFNRAIEMDPNFAMAYAALGMVYRDMGEDGLSNQNFSKAFELRARTTEVEGFRISAFYYSYVTGELLKANEYYQVWAERYPNEAVPHANWALNCNALGEYDLAVKETVEALRLEPTLGPALGNLEGFYTSVKELRKAREIYERALALKLDGVALRGNRYGVAFLERDTAMMDSLMKWASDKPGADDLLLSLQSDTEAFYGRLHRARDYSNRAVQSAMRNGQKESGASRLLDAALREVEFGNLELARSQARRALSLAPTPGVQILAAVILARAGDIVTPRKLANDLEKRYPLNTPFNGYWLPTIRAAINLSGKSPAKAVETLEVASPYELGQPDPTVGLGGLLYPAYLRGQAYLQLGQGAQAAAEFQKLIDNWGVVQNAPLGVLARLQLGRAQAMIGNDVAARKSYDDFLTLWRDADPDLPVLLQAKEEYAKLK